MKIAFHGAAQTVTGSKHLITLSNENKILLDCGLFQGMGKDTDTYNREFGFNAGEVKAVVLSHAHIDHSGLLPRLWKEGFRGKIFCTTGTKELAELLLRDSAEIQQNEAKYHNKGSKAQGKPLVSPLYAVEDAEACLALFEDRPYQQWFEILPGVEVLFTDAGHIIGSSCVHLKIRDKEKNVRLTFSGDVGRYRDVILKSPETFPQADFIIMESTYGNSLHENIEESIDTLLKWIEKTCIQKKGKLIIPAFSLGRTQEILFTLNQLELENRLPAIPYYLDSPLSMEVTEVVKKFSHYFNKRIQKILEQDDDPFHFKGLRYIKSVEESKQLNFSNDPCVIISASGMAEAGRVKHHISNTIENSRNTILLTGYSEPNSLGGRLISGNKEVSIFGVRHEVNAEVSSIRSMSAHGDYEDLCQWLACQDQLQIKKLFLVHGEYDVQSAFKDRLIKKGFSEVEIPKRHQEYGIG